MASQGCRDVPERRVLQRLGFLPRPVRDGICARYTVRLACVDDTDRADRHFSHLYC